MITHHLMSGGDAQRTSDAPNVIQPRVNSLNFPGFTETLSLMRWMVTRTTGPSANVSICFPGDAWLDGRMDGWMDSTLVWLRSGKAALSRYATASVRWQTSVSASLRKHIHKRITKARTQMTLYTAQERVCVRFSA